MESTEQRTPETEQAKQKRIEQEQLGARLADDGICQRCGARGCALTYCSSCSAALGGQC